MSFTDDDLKWLKEHLEDMHDDYDDNCQQLPPKKIYALLARLEAAELALEDADCDCKGTNKDEDLIDVCRFYRRKEAWRKAVGE